MEILSEIFSKKKVPASLLRDPRDFAPGPGGTLIVVERDEGRAVVYDSDGGFIRELGGKVEMPAETGRIKNGRYYAIVTNPKTDESIPMDLFWWKTIQRIH